MMSRTVSVLHLVDEKNDSRTVDNVIDIIAIDGAIFEIEMRDADRQIPRASLPLLPGNDTFPWK